MAGFMAGFGSAFSRSFEASRERSAAEAQDMFRLQYQDYITRRDANVTLDKQNKKRINQSKALAKYYNQPEASWTQIYDFLDNGIDVEKELQNGLKFNVEPNNQISGDNSGKDDGSNDLAKAAGSSVNAQMTASGMQPAGTPADKGLFEDQGANQPASDPRDQMSSNPAYTRATGKVAGAAGVSEQEVSDTLSGANAPSSPIPSDPNLKISWTKPGSGKPDPWKVTSSDEALIYKTWADRFGNDDDKALANRILNDFKHKDIEDARVKGTAAGTLPIVDRGVKLGPDGKTTGEVVHRIEDAQGNSVWQDTRGQVVPEDQIRVYNANAEKQIEGDKGYFAELTKDYNQKIADLHTMAYEVDDMSTLAANHPEAVGMSGDVSQFVDKYVRAGKGIVTTLTGQDMFDADGRVSMDKINSSLGQLSDTEKEVEEKISTLDDRNAQNAYYAILLDIKATKLAYMYAATSGQSGKSVSQNEFEAFKQSAMGGGNPKAIRAAGANAIKEAYRAAKISEASINKDSEPVRRFEEKYSLPYPYQPVSGVDESIDRDPEYSKKIRSYLDENPDAGNEIVGEKAPKGIPEEEGALWSTLSSKGRELLKKKYGVK